MWDHRGGKSSLKRILPWLRKNTSITRIGMTSLCSMLPWGRPRGTSKKPFYPVRTAHFCSLIYFNGMIINGVRGIYQLIVLRLWRPQQSDLTARVCYLHSNTVMKLYALGSMLGFLRGINVIRWATKCISLLINIVWEELSVTVEQHKWSSRFVGISLMPSLCCACKKKKHKRHPCWSVRRELSCYIKWDYVAWKKKHSGTFHPCRTYSNISLCRDL